MSHNIEIVATRKFTAKKKNGKRTGGVETVHFSTLQTPTGVTRLIMQEKDPIQGYKDWVRKNFSEPQQRPIYQDFDVWGEFEPIRHEVYTVADEHIKELEQWIAELDEDGFKIEIFSN